MRRKRRRRRRLGGYKDAAGVGENCRYTLVFSFGSGGVVLSVCVQQTNSLFAKGGKYIGVYNLVTHADQTSLITNYEYKYVKSVFALSLSLALFLCCCCCLRASIFY